MKRIIYIIAFLLFANEVSFAQLAGQKFIQGNAMVNFNNHDYDVTQNGLKSMDYGYSFDIWIGKFQKDNYATGWLFGSTLDGGKANYLLLQNNEYQTVDRSGINGVGVSVGRFWNFYKPFNDKFGIYGGPNFRLSYNYTNKYEPSSGSNPSQYLTQTKTNAVGLSLGLGGSIYYALSPKWWIEATVAYANPISLQYSSADSGIEGNLNNNSKTFSYQLSPQLALPSVGLGLRYFLK